MDLHEAIERAKDSLQETFGPEGYDHFRLEGWEDSYDCWYVIVSTEYTPPEGTAAYALSLLTGGRRSFRKVAIKKSCGDVQSIQPVPNPYAATTSTDT